MCVCVCFESKEGAKAVRMSEVKGGLTNERGRGREAVVHDVLRRHLLVVVIVVMLVLGVAGWDDDGDDCRQTEQEGTLLL